MACERIALRDSSEKVAVFVLTIRMGFLGAAPAGRSWDGSIKGYQRLKGWDGQDGRHFAREWVLLGGPQRRHSVRTERFGSALVVKSSSACVEDCGVRRIRGLAEALAAQSTGRQRVGVCVAIQDQGPGLDVISGWLCPVRG